jgi:transposase
MWARQNASRMAAQVGGLTMRRLKPLDAVELNTALQRMAHGSDYMRFVHRAHCVLLVTAGRSCYEVGAWFGRDPRTIERWVRSYDLYGVSGLKPRSSSGRPATLTVNQLRQLERDLTLAPTAFNYDYVHWTGSVLACHLRRVYAIELSVRHCQRMLHAINAHKQSDTHPDCVVLSDAAGLPAFKAKANEDLARSQFAVKETDNSSGVDI